jgi:hypothetical protein
MPGVVEIRISMPMQEDLSPTMYVKAALRKIASSILRHGHNVERAAIHGNWNYSVHTDTSAGYQPSLWETPDGGEPWERGTSTN